MLKILEILELQNVLMPLSEFDEFLFENKIYDLKRMDGDFSVIFRIYGDPVSIF
jgi:hypothetical protein